MRRPVEVSDILNLEGIDKEEKLRLIKLWLQSESLDLRIEDPSVKWWQFWRWL